ncbi:MAG: cupin domain-containing protein [Chloroflexota bacterium]|jgi:quercetin dioxygenase-like cupin family protein|nr:MAG: cupin domain-containing protein [Chloroflexota bacterium]
MTDNLNPNVEIWAGEAPPSEAEIDLLLREQGLSAYRWSNGPGDTYGRHSHPFHKVIYVVQGSITFILPDRGEKLTLNAGDRLDLPKDVAHEAEVGPQGVICLEAHQR